MNAVTNPRDFDLRALFDALDEKRRTRDFTWAAVAREVNRFQTAGHPMAASTITGYRTRQVAEGDGVLQVLLWLCRTPESFIPGLDAPDMNRFALPMVRDDQILRFDTKSLYAALDAARAVRQLSWRDVGREIGGQLAGPPTRLANGGRTAFPEVTRITQWLGEPVAKFTRALLRPG